MIKTIKIFLILLLFFITANAQTFPVKTISETGTRENRINMVFLGDGYRQEEMNKYLVDVQKTVNKIFEESSYKEFKYLFNVYAIEVPSQESGTSHPGTAPDCGGYKDSVFVRDTYFKTTFDYGSPPNNVHRLLVPKETGKIYTLLMNSIPDYDVVMMIVNHPWYGGSGGSFSTFSINIQSSEIAIHEAGHSFAGLADEYEYGASDPIYYDGINFTYQTDRDKIPWKLWIDLTTPLPTDYTYTNAIGLFEGAFYRSKGVYRPKYDCKMRSLYVPFCEVCKEQHVKTVFNYLDIIDGYDPEEDTVTIFLNETREFKINTLPLTTGSLEVEWFFDDNKIAENINAISINASALAKGTYKLLAKVKYTTDLVRNDPLNYLTNWNEWTVVISNYTDVNDGTKILREFVLEQNYPNPFNPETAISYQLPDAGRVSLKIYDLLGREVETLVDEFKQAGNYNAEFRLKNSELSSGVYFYKLVAGNYSKTKKMIYLK